MNSVVCAVCHAPCVRNPVCTMCGCSAHEMCLAKHLRGHPDGACPKCGATTDRRPRATAPSAPGADDAVGARDTDVVGARAAVDEPDPLVCVICLERCREFIPCRTCRSRAHPQCLDRHLANDPRCPTCRTYLSTRPRPKSTTWRAPAPPTINAPLITPEGTHATPCTDVVANRLVDIVFMFFFVAFLSACASQITALGAIKEAMWTTSCICVSLGYVIVFVVAIIGIIYHTVARRLSKCIVITCIISAFALIGWLFVVIWKTGPDRRAFYVVGGGYFILSFGLLWFRLSCTARTRRCLRSAAKYCCTEV